jgi:FAD/FMN-containing dehydrogenase
VSKFGLGADQALESELVTGTGETLITNQQTNQDLYWALSGGGGGTYGVVSSLTIKVYPDLTSSAATLSSASRGADGDAF